MIPQLLSTSIREGNSSELVPPLMLKSNQEPVILKLSDITPSEIDFHCCSVLESILSNKLPVSNICNKMLTMKTGDDDMMLRDEKIRRQRVLEFLRTCMWKVSSSVSNKKLIFSGKIDRVPGPEDLLYPL